MDGAQVVAMLRRMVQSSDGRSAINEAVAFVKLLPRAFAERVRLAGLEMQRAGKAVATAAILGVVALLMGVTAWAALWFAIAFGLVALGLPWGGAAALIVVINLVGAALAAWRITKLTHLMAMPATMRRLTLAEPGESIAPDSEKQRVQAREQLDSMRKAGLHD